MLFHDKRAPGWLKWMPLALSALLITLLQLPHFALHPVYGYASYGLCMLFFVRAIGDGQPVVAYGMALVLPLYAWALGFAEAESLMLPGYFVAAFLIIYLLRRCTWRRAVAASVAGALICALNTALIVFFRKEYTLPRALGYALLRQIWPCIGVTLGSLAGVWLARRDNNARCA